MTERIHDDELDTSEAVVRALLGSQLPAWADLELTRVGGTGTSNALWLVARGRDPIALVRLPRTRRAEHGLRTELDLLPRLAALDLPFQTPTLLHAGTPIDDFPLGWAATDWLGGADAWTERRAVADAGPTFASQLAAVVRTVGALRDLPAPPRASGRRGGPLAALLTVLDHWLTDPRWRASDHLPVEAIRRRVDEARELVDEPVDTVFLHGDLLPGNLLVEPPHITAVLDWGGAGYGDPADDFVAAWAVLDRQARGAFRTELEIDDVAWLRARTFALEQAVGGVLYYEPRRHPLGDVMRRTLDRILEPG